MVRNCDWYHFLPSIPARTPLWWFATVIHNICFHIYQTLEVQVATFLEHSKEEAWWSYFFPFSTCLLNSRYPTPLFAYSRDMTTPTHFPELLYDYWQQWLGTFASIFLNAAKNFLALSQNSGSSSKLSFCPIFPDLVWELKLQMVWGLKLQRYWIFACTFWNICKLFFLYLCSSCETYIFANTKSFFQKYTQF